MVIVTKTTSIMLTPRRRIGFNFSVSGVLIVANRKDLGKLNIDL